LSALAALGVYGLAVLLIVSGMLLASSLLGERHHERATAKPYESGIAPTGSARIRLYAPFYLVGMLFVLFDLEAAFLFAWAIAFHKLGWTGWLGAMSFLAVLVVGLVYEWRMGALDWGSGGGKSV
jgi:NADH-quinone oxidoreductase subunit A